MINKAFRVIVESWPTPDGKPFDQQDPAWWNQIVEDFGHSKDIPEWLPNDLEEYIHAYIPEDGPPKSGRHICYKGRLILSVPALFRKHFWVQQSAERQVRMLAEWGCVVRFETAEIGAWT
ncbi:hypothetical protein B2J88_07905 [Rhodococcus sp. SRB_17]|nr:hypothetical protein [Rhodococcus sp. SRB_17]